MDLSELSSLLGQFTNEEFVDSRILNCIPWIFGAEETYVAWRDGLARQFHLESKCFFLVGSAATGFSLNPDKPGRAFRTLTTVTPDKSDLDVAVVSESIFLEAWNLIVFQERNRMLGVDRETAEQLKRNIYWGHLAPVFIPRNSNPARTMLMLRATCGRHANLRGYKTSVRLYRRLDDLRGYQINSLRKLRLAVKQRGEST